MYIEHTISTKENLSGTPKCNNIKRKVHLTPGHKGPEVEQRYSSTFPLTLALSHLDTGFSLFPSVYKQMLRWFPRFQVATTCFLCSHPDLTFWRRNYFFNFSTPVYKMLIIQEPNTLEL